MYRLGFLPYKEDIVLSEIDPTMVVYRAKSLNPSFPGLMDLAFYQIKVVMVFAKIKNVIQIFAHLVKYVLNKE